MTWIILLLLIVALIVLRQSLVLVLAVATAYVHMFIAKSKIEFLIQDGAVQTGDRGGQRLRRRGRA